MYLVYIARPSDNVHPTDDSISNIWRLKNYQGDLKCECISIHRHWCHTTMGCVIGCALRP